MLKRQGVWLVSAMVLCMPYALSTSAEENDFGKEFEPLDGFPGICKPVSWRTAPSPHQHIQELLESGNQFYCDKNGDVTRHYRRYFGMKFGGLALEVAHEHDEGAGKLAYRVYDWSIPDGYMETIYQYRETGHLPLIAKRFVPFDKNDKRPRFTKKHQSVYQANMDSLWYGISNHGVQLPEPDQQARRPTIKLLTYSGQEMEPRPGMKYDLFVEINKPVYMHCYVLDEKGVHQVYPLGDRADQPVQLAGESLFMRSRALADGALLESKDKLEAIACVAQETPLSKEILDYMTEQKNWQDINTHKPPLLMEYYADMSKSPVAFDAIRYRVSKARRPRCG